MKKIIALACMITCIFGFTACDSEPSYTEAELQKIDEAENIVKSTYVPMLLNYSQKEMKGKLLQSCDTYTSMRQQAYCTGKTLENQYLIFIFPSI